MLYIIFKVRWKALILQNISEKKLLKTNCERFFFSSRFLYYCQNAYFVVSPILETMRKRHFRGDFFYNCYNTISMKRDRHDDSLTIHGSMRFFKSPIEILKESKKFGPHIIAFFETKIPFFDHPLNECFF